MKEVTIKIEEEVYEYFKAQAEECNKSVEDIIAFSAWNYFKWNYVEMESEEEI